MKNLLKKNEQRQLNLVEELYHEGKPMSVTSMAERLGFSVRSIIMDVETIQERFPFLNLTLDNQQISMSIEYNYNLNYFYKVIFNQSSVIAMLKYLFFNNSADLIDLETHLERSSATIYRAVQQTNETLSRLHHIEIDTNPFKLIGEETDIRRFFYQLFSDIYPVYHCPFEHLDEKAITDLIIIVAKGFNFPINFVGINYMENIVAVSITRLKQKNVVEIEHPERSSVIFNHLYKNKEFVEKANKIGRVLNFKPTKKNLEQIFYIFVNSDFILPYDKTLGNSADISPYETSLNQLQNVVQTLKEEFELTLDNEEELVIELHNAITLKRHDLDAEHIIHNYKIDYMERLRKQFPHFTNRALSLFHDYCEALDIEWTDFFKTHLIYQLYIHWHSLYTQLVEQDSRISAVIITKYNPDHASFLKEYFEVHLGKLIKFKTYDKQMMALSDLKDAKEAIIISTFHLPKVEGKHVININFYPSRSDLIRINQVMLNIVDENSMNSQ